jgi:hypothetical protein
MKITTHFLKLNRCRKTEMTATGIILDGVNETPTEVQWPSL